MIQADDEKTIEDKPVVQPPVSTSSSDSVTLTQPPVSTSSSDSVPLTQPPVSSSSSDLITIEPANEDPEPVIPEIEARVFWIILTFQKIPLIQELMT